MCCLIGVPVVQGRTEDVWFPRPVGAAVFKPCSRFEGMTFVGARRMPAPPEPAFAQFAGICHFGMEARKERLFFKGCSKSNLEKYFKSQGVPLFSFGEPTLGFLGPQICSGFLDATPSKFAETQI